ncbi:A-kinase anchor protein SPHKAP isoform X2 [Scleropages formosus]|uniref:A-kinase anchor protein SPHKAP isoform X2 n=1 Tax=Scleropages formosus TaxID=113540 RepID=UPI0010FA68C4|nr:A-kinase anchor protein SPHKAP isoform X2 [Scleropages formosus]
MGHLLATLFTVMRNFTESNFQPSAMFELSESTDTEGVSTDSTLGTSVTTCKKVLCNNSLLDSTEYWLHNDKVLSRISFLDDKSENSCTMICFVNLDRHRVDKHDDSCIKKLASVSPNLPKLIDSLSVNQPKENEILLLSGLESPSSGSLDPVYHQNPCVGICLVQHGGRQQSPQPSSIVFEVNKFLIGLESQEKQPHSQLAGQRVEDDTNRSLSSIEDDFLTASEYFDSEEDAVRNDAESADAAEAFPPEERGNRLRGHRRRLSEHERSEDSEVTIRASSPMIDRTCSCGPLPPRAGYSNQTECGMHYAANVTETVLQDAFMCLSQNKTMLATQAALSVQSHPISEELPRTRTCSFELPKIVIVQSPDNHEETAEWPETMPSHNISDQEDSWNSPRLLEHRPETCGFLPAGHNPKPVELALACAANVIGTISSPQMTEQLTLEPRPVNEIDEKKNHDVDYSVSSALCGMAQLAGAFAVVDLAEETSLHGKRSDPGDIYCPSAGLLSAAQAFTAVTLHCSVAEGTSIEASRTSIAKVLIREALGVLSKPEDQSVRDFLESISCKIVNGITHPKIPCSDKDEVEEFTHVIAEDLFKYALEKAMKRRELEGSGKVPSTEGFLLESVSKLLFDVLCITSKKVCDISKSNNRSVDRQEGEDSTGVFDAVTDPGGRLFSQLQSLTTCGHPDNRENENLFQCTDSTLIVSETNEEKHVEEEQATDLPDSFSTARFKYQTTAASIKDSSYLQTQNSSKENDLTVFSSDLKQSSTEISTHNCTMTSTEKHKSRTVRDWEHKSSALSPQVTPQQSLSVSGIGVMMKMDTDSRSPVSNFADDLATTVVSMATELAAICLENSSGKQPWFCALKNGVGEGAESYLLPCRTTMRRKEPQCGSTATKKHRPPRLSEIKRKTEEQPELMERLVNRVVDESGIPDEPTDPFAKFASEVTAKIMNCPELSVVDTSKPGQPRNRLQCTAGERWSRGKAASYESIPEEDADTSNLSHTLGPGSRLGQNLSRGSSISKQSSCESITDEFSRFMVNQMENEGRGFDLLLDYYAGKNASSILSAAMQQVVTKKNGHLNVRSTCLSKQSSTESITEEFYRFMLKDMDKENKDYNLSKTKEWSNSLLPPSPRTPFCFRQSSVPDRRSSDSRLTVNSPIKANSFDGFARNLHGDTLNIYPTNTVSTTGLCKSDSCLYQRGQTDQITDILIHETWSSSIESLMRKNKIIVDLEDSVDLDVPGDLQPHVELFANRLAADIVESGKSVLGGPQEASSGQQPRPVGERRRGFKQSRPCWSSNRSQDQPSKTMGRDTACTSSSSQQSRKVPLIQIEGDHRGILTEDTKTKGQPRELPQETSTQKSTESMSCSSESDRAAVSTVGEQEQLVLSASSEESTGSWSHIAPDEDPHEETSSYIQLSEGNGNSSASSLGMADLEAFSDIITPTALVSKDVEKKDSPKSSQENIDEGTSGLSVGCNSSHRELLIMNFDLDPDSVDSELRATLQWIAASELGVPTIYFRKSQVKRVDKFLEVVQLVAQKGWRVGDLFHAVVQFYKLREEKEDSISSLFDWLLATK